MGIPRFYKWLSERYPLINNPITENNLTLPDFDNFYLDMNGIIHNCSHPQDNEVAQGLSMKDMILGICRYIDRLVQLIRPVKVLYLAVDGCAPRAKMNQQRSRRFRSAKTQAEVFAAAEADGEKIDLETLFDSNCITPGTPFMAELHEHIKFFIQKKVKEDPVWQRFETIYSGHNVPGEGEHKIMSYIREERAKPDYDPNTRHCMAGLDADLIMLALVSHEPHFSLLRKQVDFSAPRKSKSKNVTKQITRQTEELHLQLLSLTILRQYLDAEFSSDPDCPDFYNFDRVLNDWICICALCGNDFLPHLPSLDIAEGAIERLVTLYKKKLKGFGGFLTDERGAIHPERFQEYLNDIGLEERQTFQARAKRESKFKNRDDLPIGARKGDEWSTQANFKEAYYKDKFGVATAEEVGGGRLREEYFRGLNWVMAYYVVGCQAWGWYFPFHYAPMASDMKHLPAIDTRMQRGAPFPPFSQLLGCLPPFSARFLPRAFQPLMTSQSSAIKDFYPKDFEIDMNGSRSSWEGVNLLSFVDAGRLSNAVKDLEHLLTPEEVQRNKVGTTYTYVFDPTLSEEVQSAFITVGKAVRDSAGRWTGIPPGFESFGNCPCRVREIVEPPDNKPLDARLLDGVKLPLAGYPSLNFLELTHPVETKAVAVNVFGYQSRKESLLITVDPVKNTNTLLYGTPLVPDAEGNESNLPADHPDMVAAAASVLGRVCFIKYPHLVPAIATCIATPKARYSCTRRLVDKRNCRESWLAELVTAGKPIPTALVKVVKLSHGGGRRVEGEIETLVHRHLTGSTSTLGYGATVVPQPGALVETLPLERMLVDRVTGESRMSFAPETRAYTGLSAVTLATNPTDDKRFDELPPQTIENRFKIGQTVLSLHSSSYGVVGTVAGHNTDKKTVLINARVPKTVLKQHGFGMQLIYHPKYQENYVPQHQVARMLRIRGDVLGRLVSSVTFAPDYLELGLNFRVIRRPKVRQPPGTPRVWLVLPQYCRMVAQPEKPDMSLGGTKGRKPATGNQWKQGAPKVPAHQAGVQAQKQQRPRGPDFEFSGRAIQLIQEYAQRFPELLNYMANAKDGRFTQDALNIYARDPEYSTKVAAFLADLPIAKAQLIPATTRTVSRDVSMLIERAMDAVRMKETADVFEKQFEVPAWSLLLPPTRDWSMPVPRQLNADGTIRTVKPVLGERVINIGGASVPFGLRGVIITLHPHSKCIEVVWETNVMGAHTLGGMCSNGRGTLLASSKVISLTRPVVCDANPESLSSPANQVIEQIADLSLAASSSSGGASGKTSQQAKKQHAPTAKKQQGAKSQQPKTANKQSKTQQQRRKGPKQSQPQPAAQNTAEATTHLKNLLQIGGAAGTPAAAPAPQQPRQQQASVPGPAPSPALTGNALLSLLRGGVAPTTASRTAAASSAPVSRSTPDGFFDNLGKSRGSGPPQAVRDPKGTASAGQESASAKQQQTSPPLPAPEGAGQNQSATGDAAEPVPSTTKDGMILPVQMLFK